MLEILVLIIGIPIALALGDTPVSNKSIKTTDNNIYKKVDNMTTYELDQYLKGHGLYDIYGEYGRETKIEKIVQHLKNR
jgi:hypothetical protein